MVKDTPIYTSNTPSQPHFSSRDSSWWTGEKNESRDQSKDEQHSDFIPGIPQPSDSQINLTPPINQYLDSDDQYAELMPNQLYGPEKELLIHEWKAPSRPFKKHEKQFYTTVGTIVLLIALILFFAGQVLPVAVVLSVGFLVYVTTSIPPTDIENKITTYGIWTGDDFYYWEEMGRFWFTKKYDDKILHVEIARFPNRLTILIDPEEETIIAEMLSVVLIEEEPPPTYYEKVAHWLQKKIPLDIEA